MSPLVVGTTAREIGASLLRRVRSGSQVVRDVFGHHTTQSGCVDDDDVVEALASNRSNQSFHIRVLPRRPGAVNTSRTSKAAAIPAKA
jgi:ribosomal protein L25 (general stress protein Ctc)